MRQRPTLPYTFAYRTIGPTFVAGRMVNAIRPGSLARGLDSDSPAGACYESVKPESTFQPNHPLRYATHQHTTMRGTVKITLQTKGSVKSISRLMTIRRSQKTFRCTDLSLQDHRHCAHRDSCGEIALLSGWSKEIAKRRRVQPAASFAGSRNTKRLHSISEWSL